MAKSQYDPEQLEQRLQEIEAGNGKPYVPGEDPAVDMAMRLKGTSHPALSTSQITAMGMSLVIASIPSPKLSDDAFSRIEATLQKAHSQAQMSENGVDTSEIESRLRNAPKPQMSAEAFHRIEQQLLQAAKPPLFAGKSIGLFIGVPALILAFIGGILVVSNFLSNDTPSVDTQVVVDEAADTEEPASEYESEMQFAALVESTDEPTSEYESQIAIGLTEAPSVLPTDTPIDEPVFIPSVADVLELPPALVVEGTITSIEGTVLVIYDMPFDIGYNPPTISNFEVGDTVRIEGAVSPLDGDVYLVLTIAPVDDPHDHPVLVSIGEEPTDTEDSTTDGDTASVDSGEPSSSTGGSIGDVPTGGSTGESPDGDGRCEDGDDHDQGRGNDCNRPDNPGNKNP